MHTSVRPMNAREWAMLLTLAMLWGGSFFFNEIAVREVPVFTTVAVRVGLAALILLAVLRLRGEALPRRAAVWLAFAGMGLLNNAIPFSLFVWGQREVASGVASILNASTPLFTVLLAHLLTRDERLTPAKALGVAVGFVGVAVLIGPTEPGAMDVSLMAQLACVGGGLSYACAGLFGRRFRALGVSPLGAATGQVIASSLILIPLALLIDRPLAMPLPSPAALCALIGVGALSTALAYVLYFRILSAAGATNLLLVTFLIPVSAILLGTVFLGEVLAPRHLGGMALIGLGLAAIDGRPWRVLRRARAKPAAPGAS
ncbi:MAG: DMT family transporter [Pararhodobacter sp.]